MRAPDWDLTATIPCGRPFVVGLPVVASAGYKWAAPPGAPVAVEMNYLRGDDPRVMGGSVLQTLTVPATVPAGEYALQFFCYRPWLGPADTVAGARLVLTVRDTPAFSRKEVPHAPGTDDDPPAARR
jgi:hypothetical protein